MQWYSRLWYGMVWYGMVLYGVIGMVWCAVVSVVWYGMVWYSSYSFLSTVSVFHK